MIQEAFAHRRPVLCGDIGGMAEKVPDRVAGIHFRARDPRALAQAIETAVGEPELWQTLQAAIPQVHSMTLHTERLESLYCALLQRKWSVAA